MSNEFSLAALLVYSRSFVRSLATCRTTKTVDDTILKLSKSSLFVC